jgi:hypothetical protein
MMSTSSPVIPLILVMLSETLTTGFDPVKLPLVCVMSHTPGDGTQGLTCANEPNALPTKKAPELLGSIVLFMKTFDVNPCLAPDIVTPTPVLISTVRPFIEKAGEGNVVPPSVIEIWFMSAVAETPLNAGA